MNKRTRTGGLAVLLVVWLVATAGAGAGVTYGLLSDDGTASGTIQIAAGSSGPPDGQSFDDANGNGRYDAGETTYSAAELVDFSDPSANLVIPESVESIEEDRVQITASSITYSGQVEAERVSLTAKGGDISIDGTTVEAEERLSINAPNGGVSMTDGDVESERISITAKGGDISVDGTHFESEEKVSLNVPNGGISMVGGSIESEDSVSLTAKGGDISVDRTTFESEGRFTLTAPNDGISIIDGTVDSEGRISLTAKGGKISTDGASLSSEAEIRLITPNSGISMTETELSADGDVRLESNGDILANASTMESTNGAVTADLGTATATLYLDGASVDDRDDAIAYGPTGVRVVPSDSSATPS